MKRIFDFYDFGSLILARSPRRGRRGMRCSFKAGGCATRAYSRAIGTFEKGPGAPVQGAPYTATMTNEMIQTLTDGNRIVHTSTGTIARDSQGRTRQDAPLPAIGNLSAANAPHLVFIRDPVAQTSYTLNLTDKTAEKMPMPPATAGGSGPAAATQSSSRWGRPIATAAGRNGRPVAAATDRLPELFGGECPTRRKARRALARRPWKACGERSAHDTYHTRRSNRER